MGNEREIRIENQELNGESDGSDNDISDIGKENKGAKKSRKTKGKLFCQRKDLLEEIGENNGETGDANEDDTNEDDTNEDDANDDDIGDLRKENKGEKKSKRNQGKQLLQ